MKTKIILNVTHVFVSYLLNSPTDSCKCPPTNFKSSLMYFNLILMYDEDSFFSFDVDGALLL